MRIALAVELEVPDGTDLAALEMLEPSRVDPDQPWAVSAPRLVVKLGPTFDRLDVEVIRYEIHPDPAAVFQGEED